MLTPNDRFALIQEIQRRSLHNALERIGITEQAYYELSLARRSRNVEWYRTFENHGIDSRELVESETVAPTIEGFWQYRRKDASDTLDMAAQCVEKADQQGLLSELKIVPAMLHDELKDAGIIAGDSGIRLADLIRAIPVVHVYEPIFNAVASRGGYALPFPYIRFYNTAEHILQMVANCLVDWTLDYDTNGFFFGRGPEGIVRPPRDSPIMRTLTTLVQFAGEAALVIDHHRLPAVKDWHASPAHSWAGAAVSLGAKLIVVLHEIGHHILGHLHNNDDFVASETAADVFAARCLIGHSSSDLHELGFLLTGAEIPFTLMMAHEQFRSETHPPALQRAAYFRGVRAEMCQRLAHSFDYILYPLQYAVLGMLGLSEQTPTPLDDVANNTIANLRRNLFFGQLAN
jgi:hypothetical protein